MGSPGTGGRSGQVASSRLGGGVDEVEAERIDGTGFCSAGTFSDLAWATSKVSPPPLALSSSGEVEEEREVLEDVLDDEE